jgi:hypothetical protein
MKRSRTGERRSAGARARERLEPVPERGPQGMRAAEGRHLGQGPVVGLAQLGRVRHRLEVRHPAPRAVQRVGRLVKRQEGPLERRLPDGRLDRLEGRLRPGDRLVDRRLDEVGRQRGPADVERGSRKGLSGIGPTNRRSRQKTTVGAPRGPRARTGTRCSRGCPPGGRAPVALPEGMPAQAERAHVRASLPPSVRRLSGAWILAALSRRSSRSRSAGA